LFRATAEHAIHIHGQQGRKKQFICGCHDYLPSVSKYLRRFGLKVTPTRR
jgi:hypothetical protein